MQNHERETRRSLGWCRPSLTPEMVAKVRKLRSGTDLTLAQIAARFGVTIITVRKALRTAK